MKAEKGYRNVPEKTQDAFTDIPFKMALNDHDKRVDEYNKAMDANRKLADETVPENPGTGKKVTNAQLKKLKLSEELFEDFDFSPNSDNAPFEPEYNDLDTELEPEEVFEDEYVEDSIPVDAEFDDSMLEEGIKFDIAKEQLKRFNEGKMPKNWSPEKYLEKLVNKNHITKQQSDTLKEAFIGRK